MNSLNIKALANSVSSANPDYFCKVIAAVLVTLVFASGCAFNPCVRDAGMDTNLCDYIKVIVLVPAAKK